MYILFLDGHVGKNWLKHNNTPIDMHNQLKSISSYTIRSYMETNNLPNHIEVITENWHCEYCGTYTNYTVKCDSLNDLINFFNYIDTL